MNKLKNVEPKTDHWGAPEIMFLKLLLVLLTQRLRPATLLKKRPWDGCFPVNFAKFLRTSTLMEHLRWLLLYIVQKLWYMESFVISVAYGFRS